MGKIQQLDEHLSNMIAAGEVVERPSGIVKELVENSIDANAKHIEIQILQGGINTITIIDDGDGMDAQDAALAFGRHATSKIKEVDDLWKIHTMGFRGEALPSIASVSHVLLRTNDGKTSTEVEINYGTLVCAKPTGTPKGTMIEIKNLFQKTPARFKHLKSPQYEFSLISDIIQKFSLSHPEIGFALSHEDRSIFKTRGNGNLREVLMQIYGRDCAKTAIELHGADADYKVEGYALQPQYQRATKYYILLYINGRMVRNYHIQKSIIAAYADYMPRDRYPIVVINMIMDAQLVDVNVHPSKWEIRLSKEKQLEKLVYETIRQALLQQMEVVQVKKEIHKEKVEVQALHFTYNKDAQSKELTEEINESFQYDGKQPLDMEELRIKMEETKKAQKNIPIPKQPITREPQVQEEEETTHIYDAKQEENGIVVEEATAPYTTTSLDKEETQEEGIQDAEQTLFKDTQQPEAIHYESKERVNPSFPQLRVIGQFHNCYIIAEGEKGLYIIDQHAAQERYHYEMIRKQILQGNKDVQPLLLARRIESTMAAVSRVDDLNTLLEQLGIHLEVFGNTTFLCRELPTWMKDVNEEAFLQDMIDLWQKDANISIDALRKHAIATMACHSSIRFNRTLTMEEMKRVIMDLEKCEQPFHCPHGRPTLLCIEDKALFHDFERG